ncbi:hypothetical protein SVAN01_02594 [Stagonosporopsis vannaccii]|nr:hypothetical protein SVAN01_02594 [Stagonosporopsis vannaccii]
MNRLATNSYYQRILSFTGEALVDMAHVSEDASSSLLNPTLKKKTEYSNEPVSAATLWAIKALSYMRIATGAAVLVAPQFTCALFKYNVPVGSALLVRMVGARDGVLGELLLTAEDKNAPDGGRREIRRALWTGIAADAIDIGSLAYAVAKGHVGKPTGGLFGAGAVVFIGLGALGLRGL